MDYKNQGQKVQEQSFFTAGAGNASPTDNNFESENNLDLTNQLASWSAEQSIMQPGEFPITQPNTVPGDILTAPTSSVEATSGLGETIDADLPPTMQALPIEPTPVELPVFDEKLIRTDGDHINKKALPEINHAIDKLEKTGNAADFYTSVRGDREDPQKTPGMLGANMKSFNEEIA